LSSTAARYLVIGCLVLAGEVVFGLPFNIPRYFRATTLEVFGFSNAQLGDVFAAYGVMAMLSYFPGGPIADRYSPRKLMTVSLFATGLGGFYMATFPGVKGMAMLFAWWGVTTILFFWAALIRATREWGGSTTQGRAFGVLEGGRGLVAAGLASIAVVVFSGFIPSETALVTDGDRVTAMRAVIYFYTAVTFATALFCWFAIPDENDPRGTPRPNPLQGMSRVLRSRSVWVQAMIVVCAYCGYKGLDNYSLYAVQVLDMSEVEAARFTASCAYIRPAAAFGAGLLADRFSARNVIGGVFGVLVLSYGILGQLAPSPSLVNLIFANIFISYFGVYALRGVYFALLEETQVPSVQTGTAVGLISVIGYTPDVFFAPVAGRLLDRSPGVTGHQHYFILLTGIAAAGMLTVFVLKALVNRQPTHRELN
jgi:nitrate/nitrite transporter NarK